jgi:hypothetical protein
LASSIALATPASVPLMTSGRHFQDGRHRPRRRLGSFGHRVRASLDQLETIGKREHTRGLQGAILAEAVACIVVRL